MKLKVLVVEDEPAHAEAIRRALNKADGAFEIRVAGTLREFRELAAADPPDIALMDLNLPDGHALEFLTSPPEAGPFPVLVMTSYGSEKVAVEAMKSGALDYLVKSPETFSDIQRTVERSVREWWLIQEKKGFEEALNQSEARFRRAQQAAHVGIWEWDIIADRLFWCEEMYALFEKDPQTFIPTNQAVLDCIVPEDRSLAAKAVEETLKEGAPFEVEYRIRDTHREIKWLKAKGEVRFNPQGRPVLATGTIQDVTAQKQSEERLRESHTRFKLANRATFDAIWDLDLLTNSVWRNENFQTLFGYRAEELDPTIESWTNCIHPEDRDRLKAGIRQAIDSGEQLWSDHYRFRRKDGTYAEVEDRGFIHREASGRPVRIIGAMQDISKRKRTDEALRRSELKYRRLYASLMDAFVSVDMTGRITEFNQTYAALLGYSEEELLRLTYVDITPERWHSLERDLLDNQILVRGYSDIYEKEYRRKNGTVFPVEMRTFLIRDSNDRPEGMWAIVRDISERKRVENERLRLTSAIEQSADTVVVTDTKGIIQYVNPSFTAVSGYTSEEAVGQNPRVLKSGLQDEHFYRDLWETISSGRVWQGRMVNRRKDGTLFTEEATISPVSDNSGDIVNYVAVKRDISPQLRLNEEKEKLEAQLRQAQKMEAVGRWPAGVAHDFNNMLGVILGYTELALKRLIPANPASRSPGSQQGRPAFGRADPPAAGLLPKADRGAQGARLERHRRPSMQKMLRRLIGEDIELAGIPAHRPLADPPGPVPGGSDPANLAVNARDAIRGWGPSPSRRQRRHGRGLFRAHRDVTGRRIRHGWR